MREIKFRAKVKGDAGLWNVWKIDWLNQQVELDGAREGSWMSMQKIQALMEFTGYQDYHGEDIYEGDVIQTHEKIGLVCFNHKLGQWGILTEDKIFSLTSLLKYSEIIGNEYTYDKSCAENL